MDTSTLKEGEIVITYATNSSNSIKIEEPAPMADASLFEDQSSYTAFKQYYSRRYLGSFEDDPPAPLEPQLNELEVKDQFKSLMLANGFVKTLSVTERITHEVKLGAMEEYKRPGLLCGICGDPSCPWSTK